MFWLQQPHACREENDEDDNSHRTLGPRVSFGGFGVENDPGPTKARVRATYATRYTKLENSAHNVLRCCTTTTTTDTTILALVSSPATAAA
ncbi:hypothetical protein HGRIS_014638 [Hohenbuehelia grisea]|uniref:Uncharacterized protein n=1 Tax=Hohenbuehelia grisea TaxID=104357 RepID=A0ABR3JWA9_9AGAR